MGKSCKVVVCGQAAVGKTAILEQLLYGNHVVGACRGWARGRAVPDPPPVTLPPAPQAPR